MTQIIFNIVSVLFAFLFFCVTNVDGTWPVWTAKILSAVYVVVGIALLWPSIMSVIF